MLPTSWTQISLRALPGPAQYYKVDLKQLTLQNTWCQPNLGKFG